MKKTVKDALGVLAALAAAGAMWTLLKTDNLRIMPQAKAEQVTPVVHGLSTGQDRPYNPSADSLDPDWFIVRDSTANGNTPSQMGVRDSSTALGGPFFYALAGDNRVTLPVSTGISFYIRNDGTIQYQTTAGGTKAVRLKWPASPVADVTATLPNLSSNSTLAVIDAAQTWTGNQTISSQWVAYDGAGGPQAWFSPGYVAIYDSPAAANNLEMFHDSGEAVLVWSDSTEPFLTKLHGDLDGVKDVRIPAVDGYLAHLAKAQTFTAAQQVQSSRTRWFNSVASLKQTSGPMPEWAANAIAASGSTWANDVDGANTMGISIDGDAVTAEFWLPLDWEPGFTMTAMNIRGVINIGGTITVQTMTRNEGGDPFTAFAEVESVVFDDMTAPGVWTFTDPWTPTSEECPMVKFTIYCDQSGRTVSLYDFSITTTLRPI